MRQISALALAAILVAGAAPAAAQTVYKWKDARGVTHYSEAPPASGNYSTQEAVRDPVAQATAPAESGASNGPDPRCATARSNLATLQGGNAVQIDSDNDGKPDRTLGDAERASQVELARSTLKAYNCSEDGSDAAPDPGSSPSTSSNAG